jgi:hypothetical protein
MRLISWTLRSGSEHFDIYTIMFPKQYPDGNYCDIYIQETFIKKGVSVWAILGAFRFKVLKKR